MPNRRTILRSTLALAPGALTASAIAAPADETPRATDEANPVRDAEIAFAATLARRDFKAFAEFVAEDAVFIGGGKPQRGRAAVLASWKRFFEGPEAPFSWAPDSIEMLASGELALSTGLVRDPAGAVTGRFVSIWRREASGNWKIIADRGEFDPAACPEPVQDLPEVEVDPEATLEK